MPPPQRSPPGGSSAYPPRSYPVSPSAASSVGHPLPPLRPPSRTSSAMDERERWRQPGSAPPSRSDPMNMTSILGPGGPPSDSSDPRHMHYADRDRERDRPPYGPGPGYNPDREREYEYERERAWDRERERDRARGGMYPGGPSSRTAPPPQRSSIAPYGHASTSPSSQSAPPRREWSDSNPEDGPPAYHRERKWEREREYEIEREREREMRWRASQRGAGDMPHSQHGRAPSGDLRYGGPSPGMPSPPARSPRDPYSSSLPPRRSPAPGHASRAGPVGGRVREPSADVPLAAMGPESSPRHVPYLGPYDDPRAGPNPPGHGGMLPPAGRSPDRMRAPLSYGPYDGPMSERELMQRERERDRDREMMAGDRYGRRMHGEPLMKDEPMYDRYGPRGPPSGPLGPPSSKSASGRGYDDRGPPPPLPYPPASPTQSRDGDRRKDKPKPAPSVGSAASRESSVPIQSRPGAYPGRPDERGSGPLPPHFEPERHPRSGPPPMGSAKVDPGAPVRRAPLSPSSERGGASYRDGPPHRGPSMPPYGGPPSERDLREREREIAMQREREMEAEHERERMRQREREREREREVELEREREMERERLRMEEIERKRQREREMELERERKLELEREKEREREKEKERERRERRREKQQAEKMAAMEREKERERHAQAQAQAHAAAQAAQMHPGALGELPPHIRPPPASLEEALIATAQQQAAAYGRPPTMADFHAAAAAIGYPPGMPLPPAIHPAMFGGMGPGSEAMIPHQPHVIRDPNAGPRVDSEPVWLYLELCERDESIRRAARLPLDVMAEEQKEQVAAELAGVAPEAPAPAVVDGEEAAAEATQEQSEEQAEAQTKEMEKEEAKADPTIPVNAAPIDPLPRHLIGMDKGRPVRHLGSYLYDLTVDPLFPAELLARNVGSTLEVRIPGDLLSCGGKGGPNWEQYRKLEAECLAKCEIGDGLKELLEGERGSEALHGSGNNWRLGWRGKEHARMSWEVKIEEKIAEAQLFGLKIPSGGSKPAETPAEEEEKAADAEAKKGEKANDGKQEKGSQVSPWKFWRLSPVLRRKLWGTDVYTDDSDVLAMCVHAGWVEGPSLESEGIPAWVPPGRAARAWNGLTASSTTDAPSKTVDANNDVEMVEADAAAAAAKKPSTASASCDLSVILRIAPKLIAYKGCQRGGIKSRSWGNSHDGVSLVVESVELKQPGYAQSKGRRSAKSRIEQLALYRSLVEGKSDISHVEKEKEVDLHKLAKQTQLIPLKSVVGGLKRQREDEGEEAGAKKERLFWEIQ